MNKKESNRLLVLLVFLSVFISTVGVGMAATDDGNLKLDTGTFTKDLSWKQVDPLMPLVGTIILAAIFIYGVTCIAGPIASAIKINVATVTKNNELRNEGQKGIVHVMGGLFMMCVALLGIGILWNSFGPGSW